MTGLLVAIIIVQAIVIGLLGGYISGTILAHRTEQARVYAATGVTTPEERGEKVETDVIMEDFPNAPTEEDQDLIAWAKEQGLTEEDDEGLTALGRFTKRFGL